MNKPLRDQLMPKGRIIFFDEEAHKYSNELGYVYTSTTTVIGKYYEHQDFTEIAKACERIGKNPRHPKYQHYKGKSYKQLLQQWGKTTEDACEWGSEKHNFLETAVKKSTKYTLNAKGFINGRIYTLDDIIINHKYGRLSIKDFDKMGVKEKYPDIYKILVTLTKEGYHIYAEIGVYDDSYGISGLVDILCINHDTFDFIILDWKTNKAPISFKAGHYEKQVNGLLDLTKFKEADKFFFHPLSHLADSVGNHYTMQLSIYAYLVSTFGFNFKALILCHIRPIECAFKPRSDWEEVVEIYRLNYLKEEAKMLLGDHKFKNTDNTQGKLVF